MLLQKNSKAYVLENLEEITKVMGQFADEVDKECRFPIEAINKMKEYHLLGAYIPTDFGGLGCSIEELVQIAKLLGKYCASSAMIWAMHQIQLICLVHHHEENEAVKKYLTKAADYQYLIASITSEVGTGGDISRSICGIEWKEEYSKLSKKASVISYGKYADAYLVTARKGINASETDQLLVLCERTNIISEQTTEWDTLGMRGTCSPGFNIEAIFPNDFVLNLPFKDIAIQSMVPVTHILWAAVWYGVAEAALEKARNMHKRNYKQHLKAGLATSTNYDLVDLQNKLSLFKNNLQIHTHKYQEISKNLDSKSNELYEIDYSLEINTLKITSSEIALEIVQKSLFICGILGYLNNTPSSLGRSIRDIMSSIVMINNDRLYATNSSLLLLKK
ncbi:acyl-CoA dehydrogenase family protein [Priestia aryabhattai]|uniref:acyl-CoA dehydrogenase family protein n=1 Tax=Priestia aryabhattai TaxID=412384 RepID=UPI001ADD619E|nr:acyl-CoA dehydrogenase family protein [Priestia aryabhattai]QTL52729.1 acyl-CoA/acyl-ACP dehydrogenase [Priestia aryabhattai]